MNYERIYMIFVMCICIVTLLSTVSLFGYLAYLVEVKMLSISYTLVITVLVCFITTILTAVWMFKRPRVEQTLLINKEND